MALSNYEKLKITFSDDPEMLSLLKEQENNKVMRGLIERASEKEIADIFLKGNKGDKGDRGDVGHTPVLGVDFLTPDEVNQIKEELRPVKGEDYFDGEKGEPGENGEDADEDAIVEKVLKGLPAIKELQPLEIASRLNTLEGQIDFKTIKGYPTVEDFVREIKKGKLLELRDIKGAKLDMNDQRYHGGGLSTSLLTTKGDILGFSTTAARIPVGTDGQILESDSTSALGVRWVNSSAVDDHKVLNSATDTTANYLASKLTAGTGITFTTLNSGGNETTQISVASAEVTLANVSANSLTTPNSLYQMTSGVPVEFKTSGGTHLLYLNEANGRVGIGTASPSKTLEVAGTVVVNRDPTDYLMKFIDGATNILYFDHSGSNFTMIGSGAINVTAGGSNQNITLTPSGTGMVKFLNANDTSWLGAIPSTVYSGLWLGHSSPGSANFAIGANGSILYVNSMAASQPIIFTGGGQPATGGTERARFAGGSLNLLLGGLTTDGTGILQFPAATTAAGGITFGTDANFFRSAAGELRLTGGTVPIFFFSSNSYGGIFNLTGTSGTGFYWNGSGAGASAIIQTNNTTALTIDSSQNITFNSGLMIINNTSNDPKFRLQESSVTKFTLESNAGTTYFTSVNGTMLLQTNSTTALTINSSQAVTFAGNVSGSNSLLSGFNQIQASIINDYTNTNTMFTFSTVAAGSTGTYIATFPSRTDAGSAGIKTIFSLTPTYNQTGTAGATDFLINRTQTALGSGAHNFLDFQVGGTSKFSILNTGVVSNYKGVATAGWGVPAIYGANRATGQTAANASVSTYTVGAADGSFEVSANVLVTTSSAENFTVTVSYTDEGNTARTLTLNFQTIAAVIGTAINFANGAVPYEGLVVHIRAKASTAITIKTVGTFTGATYNVEGIIKQTA